MSGDLRKDIEALDRLAEGIAEAALNASDDNILAEMHALDTSGGPDNVELCLERALQQTNLSFPAARSKPQEVARLNRPSRPVSRSDFVRPKAMAGRSAFLHAVAAIARLHQVARGWLSPYAYHVACSVALTLAIPLIVVAGLPSNSLPWMICAAVIGAIGLQTLTYAAFRISAAGRSIPRLDHVVNRSHAMRNCAPEQLRTEVLGLWKASVHLQKRANSVHFASDTPEAWAGFTGWFLSFNGTFSREVTLFDGADRSDYHLYADRRRIEACYLPLFKNDIRVDFVLPYPSDEPSGSEASEHLLRCIHMIRYCRSRAIEMRQPLRARYRFFLLDNPVQTKPFCITFQRREDRVAPIVFAPSGARETSQEAGQALAIYEGRGHSDVFMKVAEVAIDRAVEIPFDTLERLLCQLVHLTLDEASATVPKQTWRRVMRSLRLYKSRSVSSLTVNASCKFNSS